jgi:hypothetical protein
MITMAREMRSTTMIIIRMTVRLAIVKHIRTTTTTTGDNMIIMMISIRISTMCEKEKK